MTDEHFADELMRLIGDAEKYECCMSLRVDEEGHAVELYLDTGRPFYSEWIPGEGADIGLLRDQDTGQVVGCRLPLMNRKLSVFHDGPLRINDGFIKEVTHEC